MGPAPGGLLDPAATSGATPRIWPSEHIGGQSVSRDHKGDKDARDPVIPLKAAKQREALAFVSDQILTDRAFKFSPALLRKLASDRWYHWGRLDVALWRGRLPGATNRSCQSRRSSSASA